jgi:hypothetical protein
MAVRMRIRRRQLALASALLPSGAHRLLSLAPFRSGDLAALEHPTLHTLVRPDRHRDKQRAS